MALSSMPLANCTGTPATKIGKRIDTENIIIP
jgi:hypothetical protein